MALFNAGMPSSAAALESLRGIAWRGKLSAAKSHTTGRYVSLLLTTDTADGLTVTATGDCVSPASPGLYLVLARAWWGASASGAGRRRLMLMVNPSATTVDSTTNVTGTELVTVDYDTEADASTSVQASDVVRLSTTDQIMLILHQDSGSTLTVDAAVARTALSLIKVGP